MRETGTGNRHSRHRAAEVRGEQLIRAAIELADPLLEGFNAVAFLDDLCVRCVDLLGVSAAGGLLVDELSRLRLVGASTKQVRVLQTFQAQDSEGPCVDANRAGAAVSIADLESNIARWPGFAPKALDAGFRAAVGLPLRVREERLGALCLYVRVPRALSPADLCAARALADAATIGLFHTLTLRSERALSGQLQYALTSRVIIEQAKGMVAGALQIDIDEAFDRLRCCSQSSGEPLHQVAERVVASSLAPQALPRPHR